jgi:DNA-binding NtrC family response regulator
MISPGSLPRAILLVDTRTVPLRRLSETLQRAGHHVIPAASFDEAKRALAVYEPAVLISALRLAAFNGIHLVHLGRLANPRMPAIILSSERDATLHEEVHRVGATLLIEPVQTPMLLSLLSDSRDADSIGHFPSRERA